MMAEPSIKNGVLNERRASVILDSIANEWRAGGDWRQRPIATALSAVTVVCGSAVISS
jgi:hypothetical protein